MPAMRKTTVSKPRPAKGSGRSLDFSTLVEAIQQVHEQSAAAVSRTINTTLTLRNWIIGAYIHHYELNGADRAKYGEKLLDRLADRLSGNQVPSCERRRLYVYRQFFQTYPQIVGSVSPLFPGASQIVRSVTAQLAIPAEKLLNALSYTLRATFGLGRPTPVHRPGPYPRRIRHSEHGQPPFCFQIPARTPEQRSTPAILGNKTEGG